MRSSGIFFSQSRLVGPDVSGQPLSPAFKWWDP